jgi:hypothetical protein
MTVRYPIATNAEAALTRPVGRAVREREAREAAGEEVEFVRELSGAPFETREAAVQIYAGLIDEEGLRPVPPEDRFCELVEVISSEGRRRVGDQAEPVCKDGHRWPRPKRPLQTAYRLSVGYWRPLSARPAAVVSQARSARKREDSRRLTAAELRAIASQPLQAVKPQQALDIGLFEVFAPGAPHLLMPDE